MQKFQTLTDAIELAKFAHRGQVDKAGLPYIEHPLRVLAKVQAQGALPYVQIAAVLHDVTEDTAFTPEMLLGLGFSEAAVEIVRLMDRGRSKKIYQNMGDHELLWVVFKGDEAHVNITADEYYYQALKRNAGALMVKHADIDDNTEAWRLAYLPQKTQDRLHAKYAKARELLNAK